MSVIDAKGLIRGAYISLVSMLRQQQSCRGRYDGDHGGYIASQLSAGSAYTNIQQGQVTIQQQRRLRNMIKALARIMMLIYSLHIRSHLSIRQLVFRVHETTQIG
jgi:hypothetical protein